MNPIDSSWAQMYQAFCSILGTNPQNFQLLYPFMDWNWPVAPVGQTSSVQQSFLDGVPQWGLVGQSQPGSLLSDAYRVWLGALVPDDGLVQQANQAYANRSYYTGVSAGATSQPAIQPGYADVPDYATWIQQHANERTVEISWETSGTSSLEDTWARGCVGFELPPFIQARNNKSVGGSPAAAQSDQVHAQVTLTFRSWGRIEISPLPWYSEATVRAKIGDRKAYRKGYSPSQPPSGKGAWILGQRGIMPLRKTSMLVGYQPTIRVESGSVSFSYGAGSQIGGFVYDSHDAQYPVIFGVEVEIFG